MIQNNTNKGVYFIQSEDQESIKIGHSIDVKTRLNGIQAVNPNSLKLLLVLEGEQALERKLHKQFKEYRKNGEWFQVSRELLDFIEKQNNIEKAYREIEQSWIGNEDLVENKEQITNNEIPKSLEYQEKAYLSERWVDRNMSYRQIAEEWNKNHPNNILTHTTFHNWIRKHNLIKLHRNPDVLRNLFVKERLNKSQIARKCKVNWRTVNKSLKEFVITRTLNVSKSECIKV